MKQCFKQEGSEIDLLLRTLKNLFKSRGIVYRDIADVLGVSETTVKRYLTGHNLTVDILERLCQTINLRISDLTDLARGEAADLPHLSQSDEEKLAQEPFLACLYFLLAKGHSPLSLQRDFAIDDAGMNRYLTTLDRWGLIELFPFNRVRIRKSPLGKIERGWPLTRSFRTNVLDDMFKSFNVNSDDWNFSFAKLSPASMGRARQMLSDLVAGLMKLSEDDRELDRSLADYWGMFVMMAPVDLMRQRVVSPPVQEQAA